MKCQNCPKVATLQITEVLADSNYEEFHFCEECAQKYLYATAVKKKSPAARRTIRSTPVKSAANIAERSSSTFATPADLAVRTITKYSKANSCRCSKASTVPLATRAKPPGGPRGRCLPQELLRLPQRPERSRESRIV